MYNAKKKRQIKTKFSYDSIGSLNLIKVSHLTSFMVLLLLLSATAHLRNFIWETELRLWNDEIIKGSQKWRAHNNLGLAYANQGYFDKAANEYLSALKIKPDFALAHNNLGIAYYNQGLFDKAVDEYAIALRRKPDLAEIHNNLGNAYYNQGRFDDALDEYTTALMLKPDFATARYNLGTVYRKRGFRQYAIKEFETVLRQEPDFIEAKKAVESLNVESAKP